MKSLAVTIEPGLQGALSDILGFAARGLLFVLILVGGYFAAKLICKLVNRVLEKTGFDRLVERGGVKRALARSKWDASDILAKTAFYFVMLCVLQLAFGIFGPNPISDVLTRIMAFLPHLFVAGVIVIVAAAVAAGARQIVGSALGGLNYGRILANCSSGLIWALGIFAALDQLQIAPAIVNGLFYALLAIVAGTVIIAAGGGGIAPMRAQWERLFSAMEREAPRIKAEASEASDRVHNRIEKWQTAAGGGEASGRPVRQNAD